MLWNLSTFWLFMAVFAVAGLSFIFALALDRIMGADGFGAFWNAVLIAGGFFLAILGANHFGRSFDDLQVAAGVGLAGAFVALAVMAVLKALLLRL